MLTSDRSKKDIKDAADYRNKELFMMAVFADILNENGKKQAAIIAPTVKMTRLSTLVMVYMACLSLEVFSNIRIP